MVQIPGASPNARNGKRAWRTSRCGTGRAARIRAVVAASFFAAGVASGQCAGDCNGDGISQVNEVIAAVSVALGNADLDSCDRADLNADGDITVEELIRAVSDALGTCSAPTATRAPVTRTSTRTKAPTSTQTERSTATPTPTRSTPPAATPTLSKDQQCQRLEYLRGDWQFLVSSLPTFYRFSRIDNGGKNCVFEGVNRSTGAAAFGVVSPSPLEDFGVIEYTTRSCLVFSMRKTSDVEMSGVLVIATLFADGECGPFNSDVLPVVAERL